MKKNVAGLIAFGTLLILIIIIAGATFIGKLYGHPVALQEVYTSPGFVALWVVMLAAACVHIIQRKLYRSSASFALHLVMCFLFAGALVTFFTADRGYVHLRQGQPVSYYVSDSDGLSRPLPFQLELLSFHIEYHPDSQTSDSDSLAPADYVSRVAIDGVDSPISMNQIARKSGFRFYQYDYDPDEAGATFLVNYDPWGTAIVYLSFLFLVVVSLWILYLRIGRSYLVYLLIGVAAIWLFIAQINPMTPILRSPLLAAHVSVIMVAYLLFLAMMAIGILALFDRKRRERLHRISRRMLYSALFSLAWGICIGAVWANISWGRYWGWDPKEAWALITLLVYAIPLHEKSLPCFARPLFYHRYIVFAFLAVLMTFLGVSFFLGGIHSYI